MKIFFYYFVRLNWWRAGKSLFQSSDDIVLQRFEEAPPYKVHVDMSRRAGPKQIKKTCKKLLKGLDATPLGIQLFDTDYVKDAETLTSDLLNGRRYVTAVVPYSTRVLIQTLRTSDGDDFTKDWVEYQGLLFHTAERAYSQRKGADGLEKLEFKLTKAWVAVKTRKGEMTEMCSNEHCDAKLEIDYENCCDSCGADVELKNFPSNLSKVYKEVSDYEAGTGKEILERVA